MLGELGLLGGSVEGWGWWIGRKDKMDEIIQHLAAATARVKNGNEV